MSNFFHVIFDDQLSVRIKDCPASGLPAYDFRVAANLPRAPHNRIDLPCGAFYCESACRMYPSLLDHDLCLPITASQIRDELSVDAALVVGRLMDLRGSRGVYRGSSSLCRGDVKTLCEGLKALLIAKPATTA